MNRFVVGISFFKCVVGFNSEGCKGKRSFASILFISIFMLILHQRCQVIYCLAFSVAGKAVAWLLLYLAVGLLHVDPRLLPELEHPCFAPPAINFQPPDFFFFF